VGKRLVKRAWLAVSGTAYLCSESPTCWPCCHAPAASGRGVLHTTPSSHSDASSLPICGLHAVRGCGCRAASRLVTHLPRLEDRQPACAGANDDGARRLGTLRKHGSCDTPAGTPHPIVVVRGASATRWYIDCWRERLSCCGGIRCRKSAGSRPRSIVQTMAYGGRCRLGRPKPGQQLVPHHEPPSYRPGR
jgi:hypothetical protein